MLAIRATAIVLIVWIVPNFFGAFPYDYSDRLNTFCNDQGDWDDYMETRLEEGEGVRESREDWGHISHVQKR